jgi:hypothetical protein
MNKFFFALMTLLALTTVKFSFAQNVRFSQLNSTSLLVSPSNAGRVDGGVEVTNLLGWHNSGDNKVGHQYFQVQGNSDFFGALQNNGRVQKSNAKKMGGYWGWGLMHYKFGKDITGFTPTNSAVTATFTGASLARHYHIAAEEQHYFGLGVSANYASGEFVEGKGLNYDLEISGGGFRYKPTTLRNTIGSNNYLDINLGLYYSIVFKNFSFETGASFAHLNKPQNDLQRDEETKLRTRAVVYTKFKYDISERYSLVQRSMFWREGLYVKSTSVDSSYRNELFSGIELMNRKFSTDKLNLSGGFYTRSLKTFMPFVQLGVTNWLDLKLSHETPLNGFNYEAYTASRTELSVRFNIGKNFQQKSVPGTRYSTW